MKCAVLGDPVSHSLSPTLHRAGYAALGLDWTYEAVRVGSGDLAAHLATLDDQWRGVSLTMPFKREVLAFAERITDRAALAGAVNTAVLVDGAVHGDNTDLPGALAALRERWDGEVSAVTILGAGATASSTALAMCDAGAREVRLLARSAERARETVAAVSRHASRPRITVGPLDDVPTGEVVVSTIPATAQTPDLVARCSQVPVLFEVVYDVWPTPLAASVGDRVLVAGLDLLSHQAALQFEIFTGSVAPLATMRRAAEEALAARTAPGAAPS